MASVATTAPSAARPLPREAEASFAMFATALSMAVMLLPTLAAMFIDERTINGANIWDKPAKFELSLIIHLVTMGLVIGLIAPKKRGGLLVRALAAVTAFCALAEIFYIVVQAARGRASHFNYETPVESMMYSIMGLGAVSLVVCAFAFGVIAVRAPRDGVGAGLKAGVLLGLTFGPVLTLAIAGLMASGAVDGPGHWVGGVRSDADAMPLFGWSTTGGDLRVPHFFATHLMQALPLLGLAADRVTPASARTVVYFGAAGGLAIVAATFAQALMGMPLLPL